MRTQIRRRSISDFSFTPIVAAVAAVLAPQAAHAINIVVDSQSDNSCYQDTECTSTTGGTTLRGAIDFLNTGDNCTNADTITFDHTVASPFVVSVSSMMQLTCAGVTIDGGGSMTSSLTQLQGVGVPSGPYLLQAVNTPNAQIKGLDISGWTYGSAGLGGYIDAYNNIIHNNADGIDIAYGGAVTIMSNAIYNNDWEGIFADSATLDIESNVIYGNGEEGIELDFDRGSTIANNTIGLDGSGNPNGNVDFGIYLYQSGGTTINSFNKISANGTDFFDSPDESTEVYGGGIYIWQSSGITIDGNKIGTDSSGQSDLSNVDGITAFCSSVSVTNNSIAAMNDHAIDFEGVSGGGSMDIHLNRINIAADGVTALGGSSYGIMLRADNCTASMAVPGKKKHASKGKKKSAVRTKSTPLGASTNIEIDHNIITNTFSAGVLLSGTSHILIDSNDISDNGGDAILIASSDNTSITGNTIKDNSGYGVNINNSATGVSILDNQSISGNATDTGYLKNVNLDFPGVPYRNDTFSANSGQANNGMTPPLITSALRNFSTNQTTVTFTLSAPPGSYQVEVCDNPDGTPGCNHVSHAPVSVTVPAVGTPGTGSVVINTMSLDNFSANATSDSNDSSEYSEVKAVTLTPAMTFSPNPPVLDFGNVAVGSSSPELSVRVMSSGTAPLRVLDVESPSCYGGAICLGGDFSCHMDCVINQDYVPTNYCTIFATYHPASLGTSSPQTIGVCSNATIGSITLTGMGVTPPPVSFDPSSFDFGTVSIGKTGASQAFTLVNLGTAAVPLGVAALDDADFVMTNNTCTTSLAPDTACEIDVAFAPQGFGLIHGNLIMPTGVSPGSLQIKRRVHGKLLTDSIGPGLAATALLTGFGTTQGIVTLPAAVDLGTFTVGSTPDSKILTITNAGNAPVNFSSITVTGPFSLTNGCIAPLQPNESCTLTLFYSSPILGDNTGTLVVLSDASGGSGTIKLTGKSVPNPIPIIAVTPTQIGFGDRLLGSASGTQRITITNIGNATGTISLGMSNTDFVINTTTCTSTLAAGSTCFADVALRPVGFGPRTGSFVVTSNATGSPFNVGLAGSGCRPYSAGSSRLSSSFGCSP